MYREKVNKVSLFLFLKVTRALILRMKLLFSFSPNSYFRKVKRFHCRKSYFNVNPETLGGKLNLSGSCKAYQDKNCSLKKLFEIPYLLSERQTQHTMTLILAWGADSN